MAGLRGAMSDMAETIRRVFQDPPSRAVDLGLGHAASHTVPFPETRAVAPGFALEALSQGVPPLEGTPPCRVEFHWEAVLREEEAWESWAVGTRVCDVPLFTPERASRLEVPALPRKAAVRRLLPEAFRIRSWPGLEPVPPPRVGNAPCAMAAPRTFRALEQVLALPVAFTGEDLLKISKALWMRYTLRLVRDTGENIRNLDILGLYRIPVRGSRQINHQSSTGRLLVTLGPESQGAPRAPFILARKKDDQSIVCCFVEDV